MATLTRTEIRKRGIFGWIMLILFWGFNALMALSLFAGLAATSETGAAAVSEAEKAGHAIGTAIGVGMIMSIWVSGAVILGLFVLFSRGKKIIIETTEG